MDKIARLNLLATLVIAFLFVYPIAKILRRLGFRSWLAVLCLIPGANVIALWLFEGAAWPGADGSSAHKPSLGRR